MLRERQRSLDGGRSRGIFREICGKARTRTLTCSQKATESAGSLLHVPTRIIWGTCEGLFFLPRGPQRTSERVGVVRAYRGNKGATRRGNDWDKATRWVLGGGKNRTSPSLHLSPSLDATEYISIPVALAGNETSNFAQGCTLYTVLEYLHPLGTPSSRGRGANLRYG